MPLMKQSPLLLYPTTFLMVLFIFVTHLHGDERSISIAPKNNNSRAALVIGNSSYKQSPLLNPVNDAKDMAAALRRAGFHTLLRIDASQKAMEAAIREFGRLLQNGRAGIFYYAGHGMQVEGRNYLIPVGADIHRESDIKYESVDAGRILSEMETAGNGLNIIILDACRNNPFATSFRSTTRGLARMDAPEGSLIAYATAPGRTAYDGDERNGVFTGALLKHMKTPGLKIEEVLKRVRVDVKNLTGKKQITWESSSLMGDFYFVEPLHETESASISLKNDIKTPYHRKKTSPPKKEPSAYSFSPDLGEKIWDLPEVIPPASPPKSKTIALKEVAVGNNYSQACKMAITNLTRKFFGHRPSDSQFIEAVYSVQCNIISRLNSGQIRAEAYIQFYTRE